MKNAFKEIFCSEEEAENSKGTYIVETSPQKRTIVFLDEMPSFKVKVNYIRLPFPYLQWGITFKEFREKFLFLRLHLTCKETPLIGLDDKVRTRFLSNISGSCQICLGNSNPNDINVEEYDEEYEEYRQYNSLKEMTADIMQRFWQSAFYPEGDLIYKIAWLNYYKEWERTGIIPADCPNIYPSLGRLGCVFPLKELMVLHKGTLLI